MRTTVVGALALGAVALALPGGLGIIFAVPFASVGAILAIRRPRVSIGWLLIGIAYGFAFVSAPISATSDQFYAGTADPMDVVLAVMTGISGGTTFLLLAILAFVFPSGALPGGRWGGVVRLGIGAGGVACVLGAVQPTMSLTLAGQVANVRVPNPIAVLPDLPVWRVITPDTAILPLVLLLAAAAVSLAARYRRSTGILHQQLRWLGAATLLVVLAVVVGLVISSIVPEVGESGLAWIPAMIAFPGIPLSILVAVLRYRLYEIDRLISRTIGYLIVTGVLALVFVGVIFAFQALLAPFLGENPVAVAASTLVVAALFQPLRRRVQAVVDRRFNRSRYDAARMLEAFAGRLRDQVDLESLDAEVRGLVVRTVAPATVGFWMRHPDAKRDE